MNFDIIVTAVIGSRRFEFQPGSIVIGDILSVRVQQVEDIHGDAEPGIKLIAEREVK
jgi:hypothetical protein